jgi:hypothetical protein
MKGQYLTIEYVIFFVIGISLVISVYYMFSNLNSIAEKNTIRSQLGAVGETIRGAAVDLNDASASSKSMINYSLSIPSRLSSCVYQVSYSAVSGMSLNCTQDQRIGAVLALYNLNITMKNIIYSTKGYIELIAYNQTVELR